jgi:acyl carrier protein
MAAMRIHNCYLPRWLHRLCCGVVGTVASATFASLGLSNFSPGHLLYQSSAVLLYLSIPIGVISAIVAGRFSIVEGIAGDVGYDELVNRNERHLTRWEIVGSFMAIAGLLLWFSSRTTGVRWYVYVPFILVGFAMSYYGNLQYEQRLKASILDHMSPRPPFDPQEFADYYFPEDQRGIAAFIRQQLDSHLPFPLAGLHPDDQFIADLHLDFWDDLGAYEIVRDTEKHFSIKIPNSDSERILTIRELVAYVQRKSEEAAQKNPSR